ncbi:hypothetical protein CBS101457_005225 [Exobasidium rhododendri]|nr:hypothetical protein CBS101457_005225 [Exobasidium rhododendri]
MSSGMIPLEDFEHAIAHLSFLPTLPSHVKEEEPMRPVTELGQRVNKQPRVYKSNRTTPPSLPLEIIYMIGRLLFESSHFSSPAWLLNIQSSSLDDHSIQSSMQVDFRALLCFSSSCKAFRSLLAPLLWNSVYFHHPRHFGEFVQLMKRYKSISSPLSMISSGCIGSVPAYEWKHEFPLRLVKELHLVMPQKYPGFNQDLLVNLLRDGMNHSLRHVIWEAEELPAASTLKAMIAEDYYMTSKQERLPVEEKSRPLLGLASEIEKADIVQWTRNSRDGESFPSSGHLQSSKDVPLKKRRGGNDSTGLSSISINCKCFWPGHPFLGQFTTLQHIQFTYYDLFLLPPHLISMLENLQYPLLTLSMSTSKTSLFHYLPLINFGCFDHLEVLDLYPVTPEYPLPQAIRRSRKTLRVLRLVLDISANFVNFDNLWKILTGSPSGVGPDQARGGEDVDEDEDGGTGPLEALEILHIDPMPQQNTAPSFVHFIEACPRLKWVNGRKSDTFAPGMEPINPDDITSAMYF